MPRPLARKAKALRALSRQTLDLTPARALTFLRAVGTTPSLYGALASVGFSSEDFEQGWTLLRAVCGSVAAPPPPVARPSSTNAAAAELEAWRGPMFVRARAALRRMHPEQEAFVFGGMSAGRRAGEAVLMVAVFLDRCAALESSSRRRATRTADRAALATLAKRGLTKGELVRVRELVRAAQTLPPLPPEVKPVNMRPRLMDLHAWLHDWSDTARTVVTRRDQLIRLGIGKRRTRKSGGGSDGALQVP